MRAYFPCYNGFIYRKMNEGMSIDRLLWFHSNPFIFLTNDLLDECIFWTYQEGWRFHYWEQQMLSETWGTFNNPFYTAHACYARASWNTFSYIRGTVNRQIQGTKKSSFCTLYIGISLKIELYGTVRANSNKLSLSFSVKFLILNPYISSGTGPGWTWVMVAGRHRSSQVVVGRRRLSQVVASHIEFE